MRPITNIADDRTRYKMMRQALTHNMADRKLAFVTVLLVVTILDGIDRPPMGKTKKGFINAAKELLPQFLEEIATFPCTVMQFAEWARDKAIHEFAVAPPLCIVWDSGVNSKYVKPLELAEELIEGIKHREVDLK